ncbi:transporter substrate-binding domain-containing protein [Aphanothece sacrum]|uniref:ABC transporter substrate-binding protein n=1 Tax=Aphanothece sacrum FPU1 TaxID=1920663 RepID=A0A401IFT6_APHSA|nr:transporter substrate-binding domain-containing protein [Aphanothece sacrum]GBF80138.1 ABC transporter substrate-binding protein [Aphanothece sacrum FPU1]
MKKILSTLILSLLLSISIANSWAADLPEIIRRGKLIVAVKNNTRPLGFSDDTQQLQGLEIDIARRLAQQLLGNPEAIILKPVNNQERLQTVIDGKVDLVIARVTINPSRAQLVNFSPAYYLDGTGLVTKNPNIQGLTALSTAKIAILKSSSTIAVIRSELPKAELIGVNSYQEALTLLEAGVVEAFAGDNSILAGWVQENSEYHQLPVRLSGEGLGVVMPKGAKYASLRGKVNEAIVRWQRSGWLAQRAKYWGLP